MSSSVSPPDRVKPPTVQSSVDPDRLGDRPPHHQWRLLGLVFLGGSVGTLLRYLITEVAPTPFNVPVAVVAINVIGAFALGFVLEALSRRGPDVGRRRGIRLLVGTGVLGGFTTYSALAVDTDTLLSQSRPGLALAYAASTLVLGLGAAALGVALGARAGERR